MNEELKKLLDGIKAKKQEVKLILSGEHVMLYAGKNLIDELL